GGEAGGKRHGRQRVLEAAQGLLERGDGGVGDAGVGVDGVRLDAVTTEGGGLNNRGDQRLAVSLTLSAMREEGVGRAPVSVGGLERRGNVGGGDVMRHAVNSFTASRTSRLLTWARRPSPLSRSFLADPAMSRGPVRIVPHVGAGSGTAAARCEAARL